MNEVGKNEQYFGSKKKSNLDEMDERHEVAVNDEVLLASDDATDEGGKLLTVVVCGICVSLHRVS